MNAPSPSGSSWRGGREERLLDPRTFPVARLAELVHALPPLGSPVKVADAEGGPEAAAWLNAHGRPARLVPAPTTPQPTRLWEPSPALARWLDAPHPLPPLPRRGEGMALDLGCGTGRDAVWLALRGWRVTAVDHLPDALDRARSLADLHGVELDLRLLDVAREPLPAESYDLVTAFRFLAGLDKMAQALAPGGTLLVQTFTDRERARTGKPKDPRLVLPTGGPPLLPRGLGLRHYRIEEHGGRELATLEAIRR